MYFVYFGEIAKTHMIGNPGGGGGVLPIMAYTGRRGEAPPERGTFFTPQVYERVGIP